LSQSRLATICYADDPLIQTKFTADPVPMVYNGTVHLYSSHDEDTAQCCEMSNWMCYITADMADWTYHGAATNPLVA
jgi:hypothetical protein